MTDDAVLILSELISNSCRHARPLSDGAYEGPGRSGATLRSGRTGGDVRRPEERAGVQTPARHPVRPDRADPAEDDRGIRAAWSVDDGGLLVLEVTDGGGPTRPRPSSPSLSAHGGRGLGIVGSLALRWGVRDAPGEVTVWALLPIRGRHARRDDSVGTGIGLPLGVPLGLPLDLAESLDDLG